MRLRVKDVDFSQKQVVVRAGKGGKDRITLLPAKVVPALQVQLAEAQTTHQMDLQAGLGWVELLFAYARKAPNADANGIGSMSLPLRNVP